MAESAAAERGVRPVPEGYHSLTPVLTVDRAAEAITFYQRAFGAQEVFRMTAQDGQRILHAELQIGDSRLMLSDELPEMSESRSPKSLGGSAGALYLYVEDVDTTFQRATAAGARVTMPVTNTFWGDRVGMVVDPFGHRWGIATRLEAVSDEEMRRRLAALGGQSA